MASFLKRFILCRIGRHERSAGRVKMKGSLTSSRCRHCGVPMRKDYRRGWIADKTAGED